MKPGAPPKAQRGVALVALLVMVTLAVGYGFYRHANLGSGQQQERQVVLQRLAQAKDALIAYAVNDAKRPGRLLCPDTTGEGNSASLLTRDDCKSYSGGLPWKTLSLTEHTDAQGGIFRYQMSPDFGGDKTSVILNSGTDTSLRLDVSAGSASNDIAAIVIATRGTVDSRNKDGDDYFYNGASDAPDDNDLIIAITRQELMAAVEQRIANELRTCLEQHASSPENVQKTYPWPAPLSNTIYKGVDGSLFGMVPDTQPGNPEVALKDSLTKLSILKNSLILPSTVAEARNQSANLLQLQQVAAYARVLFDRLYTVALALNIGALEANRQFNALDDTLAGATVNKATFTPLAGTLPGAIGGALPSLKTFQEALENSGFDIFLSELQTQNATLAIALDTARTNPTVSTLDKALTTVNEFNNRLLNFASTPNPDIEASIKAAFDASGVAANSLNAAKKNLDPTLVNQAIAGTQALFQNNENLAATILSVRDVAFRADDILAQQKILAAADTAATRAQLGSALNAAKARVASLNAGTVAMSTARATSLVAIDSAWTVAANVASNSADIQASATQATLALNQLTLVLNDNVAIESLKMMGESLNSATLQAPATVTAGKALRSPVKGIIYWSDTAAAQADKIATQARRGIINGVPNQDDGESSAYRAASRLLDSMDSETDSIALLNKYIETPSDRLLSEANTAITTTQGLLSPLLAATQQLDATMNSSMAAAAVPTVWYGKACALLAPATGSASWWAANNWKTLFFYQISDYIRPPVGQLKVNGAGTYRHVVVAAGRSAWSNASAPCDWKPQATIPRSTATYLESGNAHPSRDGDAKTPIKTFSAGPIITKTQADLEALKPSCPLPLPIPYPPVAKYPITIFNDRLAH